MNPKLFPLLVLVSCTMAALRAPTSFDEKQSKSALDWLRLISQRLAMDQKTAMLLAKPIYINVNQGSYMETNTYNNQGDEYYGDEDEEEEEDSEEQEEQEEPPRRRMRPLQPRKVTEEEVKEQEVLRRRMRPSRLTLKDSLKD